MSEQSVPQDARQRAEAWRRFDDASRAFYLLAGEDRPAAIERLERAGQVMDHWASRLRVL